MKNKEETPITSGYYVLFLTIILMMVKFLSSNENIELSWYIVFAPMIIYIIIKIIIKVIMEAKENKENKD